MTTKIEFSSLPDGLIPVIVQDVNTGKVLMHGHMNKQAYKLTRKSGKVALFNRARGDIRTETETSGLAVKEILADCHAGSILV